VVDVGVVAVDVDVEVDVDVGDVDVAVDVEPVMACDSQVVSQGSHTRPGSDALQAPMTGTATTNDTSAMSGAWRRTSMSHA
jgi:hypothetical protein